MLVIGYVGPTVLIKQAIAWPLFKKALVRISTAMMHTGNPMLTLWKSLHSFISRLSQCFSVPFPPPKIPDRCSSAHNLLLCRPTCSTNAPHVALSSSDFSLTRSRHIAQCPPAGLFIAAAEVADRPGHRNTVSGCRWLCRGLLDVTGLGASSDGRSGARWSLSCYPHRIHLTEKYLGEGVIVLGGAWFWAPFRESLKESHNGVYLAGIGVVLSATTRPYEGIFLVAGLG